MTNQLEPKLKKQATNILEKARRIMGITRDQYAFCQYIHYRCADPRQKVSGWCCDLKEEIGQFVGISRVAVHKMAKAMEESGLISVSVGGYYKVTETWIDIESDCKQSLQKNGKQDVNFVYTGRKQSLQINREKRKQSLHTPYSIDNKEFDECENTPPPAENFNNLEEEKNKWGLVPPPPAEAAAPGLPEGTAEWTRETEDWLNKYADPTYLVRTTGPENPGVTEVEGITLPAATALTYDQYPRPKNSQELKERMRNYFVANPREWQDGVLEQSHATKWPPEKIGDCMTAFCAHQEAENNLKRTYGQYKGMLVKWFLAQPSFDRGKPGASAQQRPFNQPSDQPSPSTYMKTYS